MRSFDTPVLSFAIEFACFILLKCLGCIHNLIIQAINMGVVMVGQFAGTGKVPGNLNKTETHQ